MMECGMMGVGLLVLVGLFYVQRGRYLRGAEFQRSLEKYNEDLAMQLREVMQEPVHDEPQVVQVELKPLDDGILASYLAGGPEAPLWKGVEECCRRVMAADQAGQYDTAEEKAAAMDHLQGAGDVIGEMRRWYALSVRQQAGG